jgi:acetyl-CoA carboxylase biotin carboxyl carrier protein
LVAEREICESLAVADIVAPIPGSVWQILVAVGDSVQEGDVVAVLESMKLEIPIEAEVGGTVREVRIAEGDAVAEDDVIVVLE